MCSGRGRLKAVIANSAHVACRDTSSLLGEGDMVSFREQLSLQNDRNTVSWHI